MSAAPVTPEPLPDLIEEARRLAQAAESENLSMRLLGGVAVALRCPSAARPPLARAYKDIDFAIARHHREGAKRLFEAAGYEANVRFNTLHGHQRLEFVDPANDRRTDVFVDRVVMCHKLDLDGRLEREHETLPLADLLLLKLQVVETTERDFKDAIALLLDHPLDSGGIDPDRIAEILNEDWGWWRTATMVLERTQEFARELEGLDRAEEVRAKVRALLELVEAAPKSRKWKLRARLGDRVRWYELPDEAG